MEINHTELIHQMYAALMKDRQLVQALTDKVINSNKELNEHVVKLAKESAVYEELENSKVKRYPSLAQLGGFNKIYQRIRHGQISEEDKGAVITYLRGKLYSYSQERAQIRDRGKDRSL